MTITANGYETRSYFKIRQDLIDDIQSKYPDAPLDPSGLEGHIVDLVSNQVYKLELKMQALFNNTPATAIGPAAVSFGILKGIEPLPALAAVANLTVVGQFNTFIPQESIVRDYLGFEYQTTDDLTITLSAGNKVIILFSQAPTTGDWILRINGTAHTFAYNELDLTAHPLISSVTGNYSSGFTASVNTEPVSIETGSVGIFDAVITGRIIERSSLFRGTVDAIALIPGTATSPAWSISTFRTTPAGVVFVHNETVPLEGRDAETEEQFRARYSATPGALAGSLEGAANALMKTINDGETDDLIRNVKIRNAYEEAPVGSPNPIEVYVSGGNTRGQQIANELRLRIISAGIGTIGDESYTVIDANSDSHTVKFSRIAGVPVYVRVSVTTNALYPGDAAVKDALVAYGLSLGVGEDVIRIPGVVSALTSVPGIVDVSYLGLSTDGATYVESNITIGNYEESSWSVDDIEVI